MLEVKDVSKLNETIAQHPMLFTIISFFMLLILKKGWTIYTLCHGACNRL